VLSLAKFLSPRESDCIRYLSKDANKLGASRTFEICLRVQSSRGLKSTTRPLEDMLKIF
jgi:hypothetical protein